jgi:two-component sensor histidine kinase
LAGVGIPTLFAWSVLLDFSRADAEAELRTRIANIARENKIFEQKLWISRNAWTTLLHGSVQSALTAALIRTQAGTLDLESLALIEKDLERATTALNSTPRNSLSSAWSLNDLKQTWSGICEINLNLDRRDELLGLITSSEILSIVLNEVSKELVSNAIRHGGASEVAFELSQSNGGDLQLRCTNNGSELSPTAKQNLGSALFEQLLLNPVLSWDAPSQRVQFNATIPVQSEE